MSYAQSGEDEMILALAAKMPGIPHTFVDIGAGDGERWSNTRLLFDQGWVGEWHEADSERGARALAVNPWTYIGGVNAHGSFPHTRFYHGMGVLSIDIDGMDYWVWKESYRYAWRPWIVVIEAQFQPGTMNRDPWKDEWVQPYDPAWVWPDDPATETYDWGATPAALIALGKELGYTYVGKPDDPHNPNLFFVRSDVRQVELRPANLVDH